MRAVTINCELTWPGLTMRNVIATRCHMSNKIESDSLTQLDPGLDHNTPAHAIELNYI